MLVRPDLDEYDPMYEPYIRLVPDGHLADLLARTCERTIRLLQQIPEWRWSYRYSEGKWSLKDVVGHMIDNERIAGYRLLRIARGDRTPLPGFDQEEYAKRAMYDAFAMKDLIEDYRICRRSTLAIMRGVPQEAWPRRGRANDCELSARALAYVIAGHELHHVAVIRDKYLGEPQA